MIYIVPLEATKDEDIIPVDDEAGVAYYFLTSANEKPELIYKILWLIFSDTIFNLLFFQLPQKLYLQYVYKRLKDGMFSNFFWGDKHFANRFIRPILKR